MNSHPSPGNSFIGLTLSEGPYAGKSIYYAEKVTPKVSKGQQVTTGQVIGTMTAGGEFGWAQGGSSNLPLAESIPGSGNGTTESSCAGCSYNRLLKSLGCRGGVVQGREYGTMPAGYP